MAGSGCSTRGVNPGSHARLFPVLTAVMLSIAAPAGSCTVPTKIWALAPGFFALPGKSRQGLKRVCENSDYPAPKGRPELQTCPI